jgi:peptidoglycan/LPS O-acetylase OafA/YrhL
MTLAPPLPEVGLPPANTLSGKPGVSRRSLRYEPALDGLRGVAVLAVALYHAGVPWAVGGYLGVDAFFVLSGYLITALLLAEWERTGTIALGMFWARRLRRLVPALLVMLAGVALLCLVLDPSSLGSVRGDALATLGYLMNWRLIGESSSYFDQFFTSPLEHAWSLAIEEQFYLVWPLVTVVVLRVARSARALMAVAVAVAAASATWMIVRYRPDEDPSRLYYGTDTRAQALLVGAALAAAVASGLRIDGAVARRRLVALAGAGATFLVLAWVALPGTSSLLYHGGFTVFALLIGLVVLACTRVGDNPIRRVLSMDPLRRLGVLSYGVYLYHFPIYLWLDGTRTGLETGGPALTLVRLGVTLAAASVSYVFIERPIRRGTALPVPPRLRPLLAPGATLVVLALLVGTTARATVPLGEVAAADRDRRPPLGLDTGAGAGTRVLLVGDSVAYSLGVGFEGTVEKAAGLTVWNQAVLFCELVALPRLESGVVKPASSTCINWDKEWRTDVRDFQPQVAVLDIGAWEIFDRMLDGNVVPFGSPASDVLVDATLQRAVDALGSGGRPVALLTSPPFVRDVAGGSVEWTTRESWRVTHLNERIRAAAARNPARAHVIDLAGWLCPGDVCRSEIDGTRIRYDGLHYSQTDAPVVAAWLAPRLAALATGGAEVAAPATVPGS